MVGLKLGSGADDQLSGRAQHRRIVEARVYGFKFGSYLILARSCDCTD
jgi:hypothetical protein